MPRKRTRAKANELTHILQEVGQAPRIRHHLYLNLEKLLGGRHKVVALFTSFYSFGGLLTDNDADMLEEVLQNSELADGHELVLLVNSPGGQALPAERIVNICRTYGGGKFSVIVPKAAKSAATMICLGANEIHMSPTSELGPIDPQISIRNEDGSERYFAAHEIIESYNGLMKAANRTRGRVEPFLQQLNRFDARDIHRIVSAQNLSESIAVGCLKHGVFSRLSELQIKRKISPFLDPTSTTVHGRPIFHAVAEKCGLNVKLHDPRGDFWTTVWKLYARLNYMTKTTYSRMIESADNSWHASWESQ